MITDDSIDGDDNLVSFPKGGLPDIVDQPPLFPMRNRTTGLMGEAGTEGLLPLTRNSEGKLGVHAQGSGDTNIVQNFDLRGSSASPEDLRQAAKSGAERAP